MQFDFERSFVLDSLQVVGDDILITRAFHGGVVRIPRGSLQCQVVKQLDDSSVCVVDFNARVAPTEAIIGVGHESKLFTLGPVRLPPPPKVT